MTCKDIGEFCLYQQEHEREYMKMMAYIGYKSQERLLSTFGSKKPHDIPFTKLYPEFDEKRREQEEFKQMSDENKQRLIALKWDEFLGR